MDSRQGFRAVMDFENTGRPSRWETPGAWKATIRRWGTEGFDKPAGFTFPQYFKMGPIR